MKKTILLVPFLAVGVAFATGANGGTTVEGQNAIGILEVAASSKPTTVLLSVPFAGYGAATNDLKASELVAKETLPENTKLRVAAENVGDYYTWNLESGTDGKTWVPVNSVNIGKDGMETDKGATPPADEVSVGRGNSFWLVLPPSSALGKITLVGQQDASQTSSIRLSAGKWNLVGNPGVASFNVAEQITNLTDGDQISVQSGTKGMLKIYRWNEKLTQNKWTCGREAVNAITLAPGDGCWIYVQNVNAALNF